MTPHKTCSCRKDARLRRAGESTDLKPMHSPTRRNQRGVHETFRERLSFVHEWTLVLFPVHHDGAGEVFFLSASL